MLFRNNIKNGLTPSDRLRSEERRLPPPPNTPPKSPTPKPLSHWQGAKMTKQRPKLSVLVLKMLFSHFIVLGADKCEYRSCRGRGRTTRHDSRSLSAAWPPKMTKQRPTLSVLVPKCQNLALLWRFESMRKPIPQGARKHNQSCWGRKVR